MEGSILESIGLEIIGVMSPVSICMLLVVLLVYTLSSPSSSPSQVVTAANLVYLETPTDSTAQKLEGSLLNALVFVILITIVTFLLVVLYYYKFTNFLKYYMCFSAFTVLATMGGSILLSIVQHLNIPVDAITCFVFMFNFTIVGVISVFSAGAIPIIVRQSYMVCLGVIVAAWFTKLPEWTTWSLLVALAVYDLIAVLAPGGPLKMLVELASSRDDELPALVYEARPTPLRSPNGRGGPVLGLLVFGVSEDSGSVELQAVSRGGNDVDRNESPVRRVDNSSEYTAVRVGERNEIEECESFIGDEETSPLVHSSRGRNSSSTGRSRMHMGSTRGSEIVSDEERSPLVEMLGRERVEQEDVERASSGIKLGLGDFVFYSVLVGRAAMYDLMTVYACYLAIISGLGCTLILLSVCRKALPALPISITLGVIFYFLTRILMEPFVVGSSTILMMF